MRLTRKLMEFFVPASFVWVDFVSTNAKVTAARNVEPMPVEPTLSFQAIIYRSTIKAKRY